MNQNSKEDNRALYTWISYYLRKKKGGWEESKENREKGKFSLSKYPVSFTLNSGKLIPLDTDKLFLQTLWKLTAETLESSPTSTETDP